MKTYLAFQFWHSLENQGPFCQSNAINVSYSYELLYMFSTIYAHSNIINFFTTFLMILSILQVFNKSHNPETYLKTL